MGRYRTVYFFFVPIILVLFATPALSSTFGYRIYRQDVPRGSAPPNDRSRSSGWVVVDPKTGGICAIGDQPCGKDADCADSGRTDLCVVPFDTQISLTVTCVDDEDVYLAASYVLDSAMETSVVSANSDVTRCYQCSGTDEDGDGFCSEASADPMPDCDDTDPRVHPNAPQLCDGLNNDCEHPNWPATDDTNEVDQDGDGFSECAGDCDETRLDMFPGAIEVCDGVRNDCSNPRWPEPPRNEIDQDGDGFSPCALDCDDSSAAVYPGATQICDGLNNDCNDPNWPVPSANDTDADKDGFAPCAGDCDDANDRINPLAQDYCNGVDDNCDGDVDFATGMTDSDGDRIADICDNCPFVVNPAQTDTNGNNIGDVCERPTRPRRDGAADSGPRRGRRGEQ